MNPLSQKQKKFLYEQFAFGRFRWIAKPIYDLLMGSLLTWHRLEDVFAGSDQGDVSDLTAVIKTFERPYAVKRLVKSIKRRYPNLKIVVVDDSKVPLKIEGVTTIEMPFDSGISRGRNQALQELDTPYFLLLDDDFVFSKRQRLTDYLQLMRNYDEVDILGGRYIDLPFYIQHNFQNTPLMHTSNEPKLPLGTLIDGHPVVDKVQNYFVGRTDTVKAVGWKPELKVMEHTEFFTRAKGQLTTVYHRDMRILHAKTPFDYGYLQKRYRNPAAQ